MSTSPVVEEREERSKGKKLIEQVRDVMRLEHYSLRTERTYWEWIERFIP